MLILLVITILINNAISDTMNKGKQFNNIYITI